MQPMTTPNGGIPPTFTVDMPQPVTFQIGEDWYVAAADIPADALRRFTQGTADIQAQLRAGHMTREQAEVELSQRAAAEGRDGFSMAIEFLDFVLDEASRQRFAQRVRDKAYGIKVVTSVFQNLMAEYTGRPTTEDSLSSPFSSPTGTLSMPSAWNADSTPGASPSDGSAPGPSTFFEQH